MIDFSNFLKENLNGIFTTVENGKPKSRAFQFLFSDGKKVYFCTENNKAVYKQIKENPNVSFCVHKPDFSYVLSISGKVTFTNDINLKEKALNKYPALKEIFKIPSNPVFELFYVDVEEVDTFDFVNGYKKEKISKFNKLLQFNFLNVKVFILLVFIKFISYLQSHHIFLLIQ